MAEAAAQIVDPSTFGPSSVDQIQSKAQESVSRLAEGDWRAVIDIGEHFILPGVMILGVLFLGYLVAKYISTAASRPICRRVDETLGKFIDKVIFYAIMLGVIALLMNHYEVKMGGVAAILAAMGFAIGLAFQGTLSNFAAGILLMVFRPFKVGDVINAAGVVGRVDEIDLFTTIIDTPDNRRIIVPNSSISSGTIENVSYHTHRRVEVLVGVDYTADLQTTRQALQRAVDQHESRIVPGEKRGSAVILANLGASAVDWKVRAWVASADYFAMQEALTGAVKQELDASRIGIPFPQLQIHLPDDSDSMEARQSGAHIPPSFVGDSGTTGEPGRTRPRARENGRDSRPYVA